jgi:TetR/AcrR family acrAB operon transcriptional repressor
MRRTKEQAAETRRTILSTAEALFLEHGYDNVSLDQIAEAVGVTRGAVHWHFGNKQGLLVALREEIPSPMRELAERLERDTSVAPLGALYEFVAELLFRLQADPRRRSILRELLRVDWSTAPPPSSGETLQRELRAALTRIFEAAARRGSLPPPWTPKAAAIAFNAMLSGLINEWARGEADFELVPDALAVVKTVIDVWSATHPPAGILQEPGA